MNELLITQTQPMPVTKPETSSPKAEKSTADNTFEKLVNGAIKKQAEKNPTKPVADDQTPAQEESVQGMAIAPDIPNEILMPQQMDDGNAVLMQTIARSEVLVEWQAKVQPEIELAANDAVVLLETGESKKLAADVKPIGIEAGMAAGNEDGKLVESNNLTVAETNVEVKNGLSEEAGASQLRAVEVTDDTDETPKTVLLSDLAMNSLGNETQQIKVGENYDIDVTEPDFVKDLTETILIKSSGETTEFELSLYPKELGKVTVNVVFENGRAMVSLICENQKAQQILSSHVEDIRSLVEGNTKQIAHVDVQQENEERNQRENLDGRGQNQSHQEQQSRKPKKEEVRFFIDQLKMDMLTSA